MDSTNNLLDHQIVLSSVEIISSLNKMSKRCETFALCKAQDEKFQSKMAKIEKKLPICLENSQIFLEKIINKKLTSILTSDELAISDLFAKTFERLEASVLHIAQKNARFEHLKPFLESSKTKIREILPPVGLKRKRVDAENEKSHKRLWIEKLSSLSEIPLDIVKLICQQLGARFWPLTQVNKKFQNWHANSLAQKDAFFHMMEMSAKAAKSFMNYAVIHKRSFCNQLDRWPYDNTNYYRNATNSILYPFLIKAMQPRALACMIKNIKWTNGIETVASESFLSSLAQHTYGDLKPFFKANEKIKNIQTDRIDENFYLSLLERSRKTQNTTENANVITPLETNTFYWFVQLFGENHPELAFDLVNNIPFNLVPEERDAFFWMHMNLLSILPKLDKKSSPTTIFLRVIQSLYQNRENGFFESSGWVNDPSDVTHLQEVAEGNIENALMLLSSFDDEFNRGYGALQMVRYAFSSHTYIPGMLIDIVRHLKDQKVTSKLTVKLLHKLSEFEKDKICQFLPFIERILTDFRPKNGMENASICVDENTYAKIMCHLFSIFAKIADPRAEAAAHFLIDYLNESDMDVSENGAASTANAATLQKNQEFIFQAALPGLLSLYGTPYVLNVFLEDRPDLILKALKVCAKRDPLTALNWSLKRLNDVTFWEALRFMQKTIKNLEHTLPENMAQQIYETICAKASTENDPTLHPYLDAIFALLVPHMENFEMQINIANQISDSVLQESTFLKIYQKNKNVPNFHQDHKKFIDQMFFRDNSTFDYEFKLKCLCDLNAAQKMCVDFINSIFSVAANRDEGEEESLWETFENLYPAYIQAGGNAIEIMELVERIANDLEDNHPLKIKCLMWLMQQGNI